MEPITVTADAEEFTCNAYLVSGEAPTLVDAGTMPGVDDVIADALDEAGVDGLDRVVLTHQHHDHVGQLDAVLDRFDATLYANAAHPRRDVAIGDGDEILVGDEPCEVVETPGHAADHISLVGDDRVYSGDVVVYNDGAFDDGSFGRTDMAGQSREVLIESLHTLLDRLPDTASAMYPGHGDVYRASDGPDTVREVIERATERAERREPKYPDE
ncbi:MBL fold metallo-hydrolase [Halorubrum lacusprofundi]|jgi:glyoxylase-like metal-dependent hydrolase (beta-lactamase superfamily II)|uniref:Beta-lactamase domain protein n=1 Tax=Halorubrum lacusprofundi (strain ATCC 49239 / DSM 5036 / JCM 8891 / ACAM 34) TaxID=416348 RepID=B9LSE1_HALLT|nr:MBL fold metallo-hydrolase [Halorubrum lacusprofundi]ACM55986.1 beta-lactamase domain protein [Halorubrum lacusprofundi ATCC 49239]